MYGNDGIDVATNFDSYAMNFDDKTFEILRRSFTVLFEFKITITSSNNDGLCRSRADIGNFIILPSDIAFW